MNAEGTSANIKTHAALVSAALNGALRRTDQAVDLAEKIRTTASAAEAVAYANELAALTKNLSGDLQQAKAEMELLMKGEGLENAPR